MALPIICDIAEPMPTVFVVDDDVRTRQSLEVLIGAAGWHPETFASGGAFLARPTGTVPGCVVMDVTHLDGDGLALQQRIAEMCGELPVIFIAGHVEVSVAVRAMKAGALELLTRPFSDDVLLGVIGEAIERSRVALREQAERRAVQERYDVLSHRERQVMTLVVAGLLNKQVGAELGISEITVKAHRGRAMHKMRAGSLPELVRMSAKLPRGG